MIQKPTYLVVNRFDDEFSEYHRYLDQDACRLVYICLPDATVRIDNARALHVEVVDDLRYETLLPVAARLGATVGGFQGIAGVSEFDLYDVARLRAAMHIPGIQPELALRFRDKTVMKAAILAAGLAAPPFMALTQTTTPAEIEASIGFPAIIKPRDGAASAGVVKVNDLEELVAVYPTIDPTAYEAERFVVGDIFHVDGLRVGGWFHLVSASAYVGSCLAFAHGRSLGSVLLDEGERRESLIVFADACLTALGLTDGTFHLELIVDGTSGAPVFLEVGLRPGGGEIPFVHLDLFGIDLVGEAVRLALGLPPMSGPPQGPTTGGGFVMVPEPVEVPCRVRHRTSLSGQIPGVYRQILPEPGDVLDGKGGYARIGGRFHLRGPDEAAVRRSVAEVITHYRLITEPVALVNA